MKIKWEHNGRSYEMYRKASGELYINHVCLHSDCDKILHGLNSENEDDVENAKRLAEKLYEEGDRKIIEWTYQMHKKYENKSMINYLMKNLPFFIACLIVLGFVIYLIYQLWWFFVGDWAFNGPFADDITAGEVTFETILLFIAFIVIIEEVIRRIRNGHF